MATSQTTRAGRARAAAPKKDVGNETWEWIKSLGIAVVLFLIIRTFLVQAFSIPSKSMENTLLVGDYLMANNAIYGPHIPFTASRLPGFREPRHGDIVVFRPTYNQPVIDVVKRVIGQPGDTLQMKGGVVYRNGKPLNEPYTVAPSAPDEPIAFTGTGNPSLLPPEVDPARYGYHNQVPALLPAVDRQTYHPTRNNWGPLVVPKDSYWLMGDNRDESLDSRFMGFIPRDEIYGKPMFIYYSYDPEMERPFPKLVTAARWGRIGTVIH